MTWPDVWGWIKDYSGLLALLIASYSAWVSRRRLRVAAENNLIAASAPWGQLLTSKIGEEIKAALNDRSLFIRIFNVPFKSVDEKVERRAELTKLREDSGNALAFLEALSSDGKKLQDARGLLERSRDSYFHNNDLQLPVAQAQRILAEYEIDFRAYLLELRRFAMTLSIERIGRERWSWRRVFGVRR